MSSAPIIQFQDISKRFPGGVTAVDGVSLDIANNEFFALLGPSGCGKTTLLRMLAGFETPTEGRIMLAGSDTTRVPPNRRPVNMVFQSYAVFPHMTVGENVAYGLRVTGVPKSEIAPRVSEALAMVKLGTYADRKPDQLSGGQRQRVALARALIKRPKVLLLDEPLSALDKKLREEMQLELVRLRHEVGITFIMVTHDQEEAMSVSSRIGVMEAGRITQMGAPVEIYEQPRSRFVADFIGSINLFEGRVAAVSAGTVRIHSADAGCDLMAEDADAPEAGSTVSVGVRPEKLTIRRQPAGGEVNQVAGRVLEVAYLGERSVFHIQTAAGRVIKVTHANDRRTGVAAIAAGDSVHVAWDPANSILLTC